MGNSADSGEDKGQGFESIGPTAPSGRRRIPAEPEVPRRSWQDWLWPRRNDRYWFWFADAEGDRRRRREAIHELLAGAVHPDETLDQVRDVARSAADRSVAAERRAATLSGAVAIAASLTVSGAGIVLDRSKVPDAAWRFGFAVGFALTTAMFVLAGLYAARAMVTFRQWGWPHPYLVIERQAGELGDQRLERAAEMLDDFSFSWEVSDAKLRAVDSSFRAFVGALMLLVLIALGFAAYQWWG